MELFWQAAINTTVLLVLYLLVQIVRDAMGKIEPIYKLNPNGENTLKVIFLIVLFFIFFSSFVGYFVYSLSLISKGY